MEQKEASPAAVLSEGERLLSFMRNNSGPLTGVAADNRLRDFATLARQLAAAAGGHPELKTPVLDVIRSGKECLQQGVSVSLVASSVEKLKAACNALPQGAETGASGDAGGSRVKTWEQVAAKESISPRSTSPRSVTGMSPRPLRPGPGTYSSSDKLPSARGPAAASAAVVSNVARRPSSTQLDLNQVEALFGEEVTFESVLAKSPRKRI